MDVLVLISNCPQINNPCNGFDPTPVRMIVTAAGGSEMSAIEVVRPGMSTTVQDWPGRVGYWHVGVPADGPDGRPVVPARQPRVGNPEGAPGLECAR